MKQTLKPKEKMVFDCIVRHKAEHDGNSPTIREIMDGVGAFSSTSTTLACLRRLQAKGWIATGENGRYRNISVIGGRWSYETGGVNSLTPGTV